MTQLKIIEKIANASNGAFLAELDDVKVIFKPSHLEKELWDFPTGTLAIRERATFVVNELLGWDLVPQTDLIETSDGLASVQLWVDAQPSLVEIFPADQVPSDWLAVLDGQGPSGEELSLAHKDDSTLARIALLDAIVNNADRKGGHVLTDVSGRSFAIDHGVTFHEEPKLRSVLWGWQDAGIDASLLADITQLSENLPTSELVELLTESELIATQERIADLLETQRYPNPSDEWPHLPWPLF